MARQSEQNFHIIRISDIIKTSFQFSSRILAYFSHSIIAESNVHIIILTLRVNIIILSNKIVKKKEFLQRIIE